MRSPIKGALQPSYSQRPADRAQSTWRVVAVTDDDRGRDGLAEMGMLAVMMFLPLVKLWG
jgi:hypothetical protein